MCGGVHYLTGGEECDKETVRSEAGGGKVSGGEGVVEGSGKSES